MKKKQPASKIAEKIKSLVNESDFEQKEILKDELLAFLLFGDTSPEYISAANESLKGLTVEEMELIRKLAKQTEDLYKASKKGDRK
jgi:hypothetical protein